MTAPEQILKEIKDLPTIPDVVLRLERHLADPDCDLGQAAKMISLDPTLASRVIRSANSPLFGGSKPTDSLQAALLRLGTRGARDVVLTVGVIAALPKLPPPLDARGFWTAGLATGLFARHLARDLGHPDEEQAYLAGLVHGLGEAILAIHQTDRYRAAVEQARERGVTIEHALTLEFGFSHAEFCGHVLESWHFSDVIAEAVAWHLDPMKAPRNSLLACIVLTADRIARDLGLGVEEPGVSQRAWIAQLPGDIEEGILRLGYPDFTFYLMERREFLNDIRTFVSSVFGNGSHGQAGSARR